MVSESCLASAASRYPTELVEAPDKAGIVWPKVALAKFINLPVTDAEDLFSNICLVWFLIIIQTNKIRWFILAVHRNMQRLQEC